MEENTQLAIQKIFGTSARNPSHFTIQDNLLGYTASGGVVICELDKSAPSKIISQRFYVANSVPQPQHAPQNSYLHTEQLPVEVKKDLFGFPINIDPIVIGTNQSTLLNLNGNNGSDIDLSSPSKLKDRIRTVNCITISPNKRLLAVGESGYQPRIILYSLAPDGTTAPIALIYEHLFGIKSLIFSPDSKFLCSLGLTNDGFLHVWKINYNFNVNLNPQGLSINLAGSNKCSSLINQIIWHEDYLITLGLRLLKVWKLDLTELNLPKPTLLKGKNVLLGKFISSNFINADILNNDEVLIITDQNDLLLLKLNYEKLTLNSLEPPNYVFSSLFIDYECDTLWLGSNDIKSMSLNDLKPAVTNTKPQISPVSPIKSSSIQSAIFKLGRLDSDNLIYLSDTEEIKIFDKKKNESHVLISALMKNISGIKLCFNQDLIVFSKAGLLRTIKNDQVDVLIDFKLPSNELIENSLTAIDVNGNEIILGDKYGNLYVVDSKNSNITYSSKAHESTINELSYVEIEENKFLISISRDRMIQIFHKTSETPWDLLQTIPTHRGNLLKLIYNRNKIYVCSSDRTISVHYIDINKEDKSDIKIFQDKILSLKNSPINMKIFEKELIISTNDKNLLIYSIDPKIEFQRSLKLFNENNESLLVENFYVENKLIYVSSNDKSLRVFNYNTGKLISTNWGHSDTILGLLINEDNKLISVGNDGCLFKWEFKASEIVRNIKNDQIMLSDCTNTINTPLYAKVTRKIIPTTPITSPRMPVKPVIRTQVRSPLHRVQATATSNSPGSSTITPTGTPKVTPTLTARSVSPLTRTTSLNQKPSSAAKARLSVTSSTRLDSQSRLKAKRSTTDIRSKLSQCVDVEGNEVHDITCTKCGYNEEVNKGNNLTINVLTILQKFKKQVHESKDLYSAYDKKMIKKEMFKILDLIDDEKKDPAEMKLLESYSNKLMELFTKKLEKTDERDENNENQDPNSQRIDNSKNNMDIKLELIESNLTKLTI